jgi:hypothetical protein
MLHCDTLETSCTFALLNTESAILVKTSDVNKDFNAKAKAWTLKAKAKDSTVKAKAKD